MAAEGPAAAGVAAAVLPREYGYVVLVLVLYTFLNYWMAAQVGAARRRFFLSFFLFFNPRPL